MEKKKEVMVVKEERCKSYYHCPGCFKLTLTPRMGECPKCKQPVRFEWARSY